MAVNGWNNWHLVSNATHILVSRNFTESFWIGGWSETFFYYLSKTITDSLILESKKWVLGQVVTPILTWPRRFSDPWRAGCHRFHEQARLTTKHRSVRQVLQLLRYGSLTLPRNVPRQNIQKVTVTFTFCHLTQLRSLFLATLVECFYANKSHPSDSTPGCIAVQYFLLWPYSISTSAGERRAFAVIVLSGSCQEYHLIACDHAA